MKRFILFTFCLSSFFTVTWAQNIIKSLEKTVPGQGKVTIYQDPRIEALIGLEHITPITGEQNFIKAQGFRVQAYAGNNTRQAKNEAYNIASKIKEYFPDLTIYTSFNPPRWLCRVGDFRSIEEADAMMRKLKATGVFKEVSIVRDQINIPL
ncbi:MAG: SPOR domain-containing protein [Bacteroides sp.]